MKYFGSKQRLYIGAWVLAALALIGLNGFAYIGLESQPLEGNSMAIRSLRQKLARLDGSLAKDVLNALDGESPRELLISALTPHRDGTRPSETEMAPATPEKTDLPTLNGIVQMADPLGEVSYTAVLNGRVCREHDQVMTFIVARITKAGVKLHRDGKEWFIQSPTPNYSGDQGK